MKHYAKRRIPAIRLIQATWRYNNIMTKGESTSTWKRFTLIKRLFTETFLTKRVLGLTKLLIALIMEKQSSDVPITFGIKSFQNTEKDRDSWILGVRNYYRNFILLKLFNYNTLPYHELLIRFCWFSLQWMLRRNWSSMEVANHILYKMSSVCSKTKISRSSSSVC